jgi:mRNA interferase MazF
MTESEAFRRGDIVLANLPLVTDSATSRARPAVIVQNDVGNRFSPNLIVAGISSQLPSREYPTNVIVRRGSPLAAGTGLDYDSVVQTEVILTITKARVVHRIGRFGDAAMAAIDQCLRVSIGLSR